MATAHIYGLALQSMLNKEIAYGTDTIKAMLCTSSYVPNLDTHRYKSSVTNEVSGTGYTAGGVTLTSKTVTYDAASHTLTLGAGGLTWTGATFTFRYVVFYGSTGTDATSPLISWIDFGTNQVASGVTVTVTLPTPGFAQFPTQ